MLKETQIYGWDTEPVDERPSEFMASSGYSVLTSYYALDHAHRTRKSRSRFGLIGMLVFVGLLLALGVYALSTLAPLLHA
jgi:uncharacterized membrane protein